MGFSNKIILLGEAWGQNEAKIGKGFVGASGIELLRMLNEAGVIEFTSEDKEYLGKYYDRSDPNMIDIVWKLHPELYRTNVFNLHPHGNAIESLCGDKAQAIKGWPKLSTRSPGWLRAEFGSELERLGDEILSVNPNLIVCLGNTPLWALGGRTGVSKIRGTTFLSTHIVADYKCLVTYHPAAVVRQWQLRPTTIIDLAKIPFEAGFVDVVRPDCSIWIEPSLDDIERFINEEVNSCEILSVDIETAGSQVTCIGFAPRADLAIVIPIYDSRRKGHNYWPTAEAERRCWEIICGVLEDQSIPKVFQNGLYDIAFLYRANKVRVMGAKEDTMLLHHALQPEALKGLGFLGSIYTKHGPWKSERGKTSTIKRDA